MQANDLFSLFSEKFHALGIPYMVTGSLAVIAYGEPRLTNDIDIVLELDDASIAKIQKAFESGYYCPPEEVLRIEQRRISRGHFNLIDYKTGLKADCYLVGDDPFQVWGLRNRRCIQIGAQDLYLAPVEYVIVKKLLFYNEGGSEKHLRDIRSIISVSSELIRHDVVSKYVEQFGVGAVWKKVIGTSE